jgi:hypothetical protein
MAMHQTTLECLRCKKFSNGSEIHHRHGFEYHMDLNLDIPQPQPTDLSCIGLPSNSAGGAAVMAPPPNLDLYQLFTNYFKSEQIEDYCCIKCTIREYLLTFLSTSDKKKIEEK